MKLKQNKSGFTLLEIIIVIIIVGVLASLALPRFFATVEFSKSAEALNAMGVIRQSLERCFLVTPNTYVGCNLDTGLGVNNLDIADPGLSPGTRFTYVVSVQGANGYVITATRNNTDGGDGVSTIVLTQNNLAVAPAPVVARAGTGSYVAIK